MKNIVQRIYDYSLEEIMGERFGQYSKYVIQDRAIPDVRDGLKPVQRRILFSMYKERNLYDKPYRKSARAVGDIMGKYHPHGDSSIYDAMVRMSQYWKMNTPFVDMHGNNGSIDGDSPAAMRYTEARLSKVACELLKDIDKNTVIFSPNYDDSLVEPTVLPAKFPNLLVNGTTGISSGYATNIPPHNLGEIIDATIYRISSPNCRLDTIMSIVKGPDFPTGAIVEGIDGIRDAYTKGKGRIVIKASYIFEKIKGVEQIIITNIPFEVNKSFLVKQMDEIRLNKKIDGIIEVRDESDKEGLRIAIDVKKDVDKELIINYLYKNTELQVSYNFNMIAIVNRRPKLLGILEILDAYIEHQKEVATLKVEFDLQHAKDRLHIVEGFIKALSILDEIVKVIRKSENKQNAQDNLCNLFSFSEKQAEAIVMLQLYKLTNTDVTLLEQEFSNLKLIITGLSAVLEDESKLMSLIVDELKSIKKEYAIPRKSIIKDEIEEIKIDNTMIIPKEEVIVVVTNEGYVKRVSLRSYQASEEETTLKDGDYVIGLYRMTTLDTMLLFTNFGNYLYVPVNEIVDAKWKELGKHISNIITLSQGESIIGCYPVYDFESEVYITSFTKLGMIKRTKLCDYKVSRYSKPILDMKLKGKDEVIDVKFNNGKNIIIITKNGYGLKYSIEEVSITNTRTSGVKSINLKDDYVVGGFIDDDAQETISLITDKGTGKRIRIKDIEISTRARKGVAISKKLKSIPQYIIKAIILDSRSYIGVVNTNEIFTIKNSELPIMDLNSIGSSITKKQVLDVYSICGINEEKSIEEIKEINLEEIDQKIMTIDDFIKDIEKE
ncbi:MAG: DNA topoisomerase IV subunit A [Bacilli bacterium]|nr:DNA topoisomerase IV subunit A [Bacilli bacterium]